MTKRPRNKPFWEVKAAADKSGDVYIYGSVVSYKWDEDDADVTAASFKKDLDALGDIDTLNIYINSPGGSVWQGQAIYTQLQRHKARKNVYVDGIAASIASVIAMAGDTVYMPKNAMMMVHNPMSIVIGYAEDMRKEADSLDKIRGALVAAYMSRLEGKTSEETLSDLMDAETWLTAEECLDYGFADELLEAREIAASADPEWLARYKNVPKDLLETLKTPPKGGESAEDKLFRQAIAEKSRAIAARVRETLTKL
jgi:ATP-dependent Clp protease protease subunit